MESANFQLIEKKWQSIFHKEKISRSKDFKKFCETTMSSSKIIAVSYLFKIEEIP